MTQWVNDEVMQKGVEWLQANATREILCEGFPASYAEATTAPATGKALADVAISSANWTIADGATDGRKITLAAQSGIPVDDSGSADHVAIVDDANSILMAVEELSGGATAVASGGPTVGIGAVVITIRDPA